MIVYTLQCAKHHAFEAWFRDSAAFEAQAAKRAITCPQCGSTKVKKAPMAPRLSKGAKERTKPEAVRAVPAAQEQLSEKTVMMRQTLESLRREIESKCDYVGERFAEEARKIHYGETPAREIYGESSDEDAAALEEEGVPFQRVPWVRRTDS